MTYRRIACLRAGAVETLYLLGAQKQIAGILSCAFHPSCARPGWDAIPARRENRFVEIKTPDLHVPGPEAIMRGIRCLTSAVDEWA